MPDTSDGPRRTDGGDTRELAPDGATGSGVDEPALERARALADLLDEAIRIPGTDIRIGLDPILGILPVAGDLVMAVLSLYPVLEAYRLDAPRLTLAWMLVLVGVDAAIGSIPVVGDVFDAFWKANEWNARALERHVEAR